jgi:hypothetical protein
MQEQDTIEQRLAQACKRALTRLSVSPFRVVAYVFHATGLEHFYKPHFTRYSALLDLTDEVVAKLPKHSLSITGARMDLMNLIFVGSERDIKRTFRQAGWNSAHPASPLHAIYGLLSMGLRRSYHSGPFTPQYVNIGLQDMAFQQLTRKNSFGQRHHLRVWRTGVVLPGAKRVWVGAASFDMRLKLQFRAPWLHHETNPDLDLERDFVVSSLESAGAAKVKTVVMGAAATEAKPYRNAYGAKYLTDGKAEVVQV